jgi:16S rRNA (guanine1207-N2)-methyltransferase
MRDRSIRMAEAPIPHQVFCVKPALETLMLACANECLWEHRPRVLFLGAEPHAELRHASDLTAWQPLKPLANACDAVGMMRVDHLPSGRWPVVLALPGKSRDEVLETFAIARERLEPGGSLVVAMSNATGAARFEKELAKAVGSVSSIQKHKCRAFRAVEDGRWNENVFEPWRALGGLHEFGNSGWVTRPGVFSHGRMDPGSQFLADHLPASLHGRAADLGAGWGFLSHAAAARCRGIRSIDLYEVDARALECARINLARNVRQDCRLEFRWHDVASGLPDSYDVILMNPPFHSGPSQDINLGRSFIRVAAASLARGGTLLLVANRGLPYEHTLGEAGLAWRTLAENQSYKIFCATARPS